MRSGVPRSCFTSALVMPFFSFADDVLGDVVALLDVDLVHEAAAGEGERGEDRARRRMENRARSEARIIIHAMSDPRELKGTGLKVTVPRLKVLDLFQHSPERHLTAEDVYRKLLEEHSDIGLATVYRVLTQFEQAGLLMRHHFEGGKAVYELNEGGHHDHLVCLQVRPRRGVLRLRDREAPEQGREGARLRDPRPPALPLRRLHQDPNCPYRPKDEGR